MDASEDEEKKTLVVVRLIKSKKIDSLLSIFYGCCIFMICLGYEIACVGAG